MNIMGGGVQWLTIGLINKIRLPILYYASPIIEGETKWIHLNHSRSDGSLADIEPSTQRHWFQTSRQQAFSAATPTTSTRPASTY